MRTLVSAAVALVLFAGSAWAGEFTGKVVKVDGDKLTLKTKDGEKTFDCKGAKFTHPNKKQADKFSTEGLKHTVFTKTGKGGAELVVITKDGADETAVEVKAGKKKAK